MEPLGYLPRYEKMNKLLEVDTRGRFMMMACDIEFTLLHIMMFATADKPKAKRRKFEDMMMKEKIDCTIADLKRHQPVLYAEYKDELDKLDEFRILRNHFAHHVMIIEDVEKPQEIEMMSIKNVNGVERLVPEKMSAMEIFSAITRFITLNLVLAELAEKLKTQFFKNNPNFQRDEPQ